MLLPPLAKMALGLRVEVVVAHLVSGAPEPPLHAESPNRPVESVLIHDPLEANAGNVGTPFALMERAETEEVAVPATVVVAR